MRIESKSPSTYDNSELGNFRHKTVIDENGVELYYAPVILKNKADRENFKDAIGKQWVLPFGRSSDKVRVYYILVPNKELAEDCWKKLNTMHSQAYRAKRCLIPGTLKPLIVCPDTNRCSHCPYPECRDKKEFREVITDKEIKVQRTVSTESPEIRRLEINWAIKEACAKISEINPLFTKAIVLKEYHNLTVEEVATELGCSVYMVRYYIRQAKAIGREFRKEYYCSDWEK